MSFIDFKAHAFYPNLNVFLTFKFVNDSIWVYIKLFLFSHPHSLYREAWVVAVETPGLAAPRTLKCSPLTFLGWRQSSYQLILECHSVL